MNQSDNPQFKIENAPDTESLADLALTGTQAEATNGGTFGQIVTFTATVTPPAATIGAGAALHLKPLTPEACTSNHNETVAEEAEDSDTAMALLADLPVSEEQEEEVKGGPDSEWRYVPVRRMG